MKPSLLSSLLACLLSVAACATDPGSDEPIADAQSAAGRSKRPTTITPVDPSTRDAECVAVCADDRAACLDGEQPDLVCAHAHASCVKECPPAAP